MNIKPFAKLIAHRPKTVLIIFTIITVIVGLQATNIYMESNFAEYLPQDDPTISLWDKIIEEFDIGSTIIILIDQAEKAYDIRTPQVLNEMDEVVRMIDTSPYSSDDGVKSVSSLSSLVKEENSKLIGGSKEIPSSVDEINAHFTKLSITSMEGILYTNSYNVTVIIIQLATGANFDSILARTSSAVENRGTTYANMTITGSVAMQKAIQKQSMRNMMIIFPIAVVLVSIVLFFFHRTIKGIIIAFLPPAFAIALTFGVLGIIQPELSIISVAIIALLMGLGVDYSIHLMNRYAEESKIEDVAERVEKILKHTGKAVFLSTVTTMIGFASLMISSMSPIITFGFGCAIGILFCFISSVIIVPCLVILLKFKKKDHISSWKKLSKFVINNRKRMIFVAAFFTVISLTLIPNIKTDASHLDFAPDGIPEVEAMYKYSEYFGTGSNFNAILVEVDPGGLSDPDVLQAIYDMEVEMRDAIRDVFPHLDQERLEKSVYSIADEILELTGLLDRSVILQKLSELIDAEEIIFDMIAKNGIVDEDFSRTLIQVAIPIGSNIEDIKAVIKNINEIAARTVLPYNGHVSHLTGQDAVVATVNSRLTEEQVRSMVIALILVLAALIIIFNSSKYGFLTMTPVVFVLMWEPGFLVTLDVPLSIATLSIASIMVGVGIDYGVHITHRFREERSNGLSKIDSIRTSIERTGSSLVEAALTTIAGISAIFIANTPALNDFVTVVILMTALSCIAAALILPVFYDLKLEK